MTSPHPAAPLIPAAPFRIALIVLALFTALSAVGGAIALLAGVIGVPLSVLEGSVFTDFFWPAILLGLVIGGTQVAATVAALRRSPRWLFWSAVAGFAMVIFIFVELAIMRGFSFLHGLYFGTGLAQLVLVVALLGVLPSVVRRDDIVDRFTTMR